MGKPVGHRHLSPAGKAGLLVVALGAGSGPAPAQVLGGPSTGLAPVHRSPSPASPVVGYLVAPELGRIDCRVDRVPPMYRIRAYEGYLTGFVEVDAVVLYEPGRAMAGADLGSPRSPLLLQGPFRYVGSAACVSCHRYEQKLGARDPHTRALKTLESQEARDAAAAYGIADPRQDGRCLKCHQTAWGAGAERLAHSFRPAEEAVGCETCHGPGSAYQELAIHAISHPKAVQLGMTDLRTLDQQEAVCRSCHNPRSPTYKRFDLLSFSEAVRHWPRLPDEAWRSYLARRTGEAPRAVKPLAEPPEVPGCSPVLAAPIPPPPEPTPAPAPGRGPTPAPPREPGRIVFLKPGILPPPFSSSGQPVAFSHQDHAHRRTPPIGCADLACHHPIPLPAGEPVRSWSCHDCHKRPGLPSPEGADMDARKAFHAACINCHRKGDGDKAPRTCSACHVAGGGGS